MDYPKNPVGLRWDEHYIMADQVFHACVESVKGRVPQPSVKAERPAAPRYFSHKRAGKRIA